MKHEIKPIYFQVHTYIYIYIMNNVYNISSYLYPDNTEQLMNIIGSI